MFNDEDQVVIIDVDTHYDIDTAIRHTLTVEELIDQLRNYNPYSEIIIMQNDKFSPITDSTVMTYDEYYGY